MKLINQHTKRIMEECKERARDAGLSFDDESLEYIVTNKDMIELSPKVMIPTLYDYWVHDVEVLKGHGKYKLAPSNPYETVINSRPAISFYNDNNPDWMNIMIFYHVLGHIDFFQNNQMFRNTWNDDFVGQALADKRMISSLRNEKGRWLDYTIEFSRAIDNLSSYLKGYSEEYKANYNSPGAALEYYFGDFLQAEKKMSSGDLYTEIDAFNLLQEKGEEMAEQLFMARIKNRYPEFQSAYQKYLKRSRAQEQDLMEFIRDHSPFLRKEKNNWMKSVMNIVRNTALYFEPQRRTKIINEGWASYWHDELFRKDDRIKGHEVAYAQLNANVTSVNRVGLNPYAIGLRLVQEVEDAANKGALNYNFRAMAGIQDRQDYNKSTGEGKAAIFALRTAFSDFSLINTFTTQDFVEKHDLFVVGKRLNKQRNTYEYYVKSRKAEDYKQMLIQSLYHPPQLKVDLEKTNDDCLYLIHQFEGKQLIQDFIGETLMAIEFLWGNDVKLETSLVKLNSEKKKVEERVVYHMKDKNLSRKAYSKA